ncbi:iron ABC transporter permease [Bacillus sp. A301a_S52]|nr:iron ABC transporter permease [Bacillus sp. A301a_S52]
MRKDITVRYCNDELSFQVNNKTIIILFSLALFFIGALIIGPSLGHKLLSPIEVLKVVVSGGSGGNDFIVMNSRLPRTFVSLLTGAALGLSGLILQGIIRNPLAAPDVIGVTSGASVGAVIFITFLSGSISISFLPVAAVVGGLIASFAVYILAWKKGVSPFRLILVGIGISAIMSAGTTFMLVFSSAVSASQAYLWLTGSVYGASWRDVTMLLVVLAVLIPCVVYFSRSLNAQQLGDDVAASLGITIERHRFILLLFSVILAGVSVAAAGAIGFVGLIAPHIARSLLGREFTSLAIGSLFIGGLIMFLADLAARTLFYPLDIPAGIFTAGVGAPFFIYLLFRNRHHF